MKYDPKKNRESVLKAYKRNPSATVTELATVTRLTQVTVYKHLKRLVQDGVIERRFVRRRGAQRITGKHNKKSDEQRRIDLVVARAKKREQAHGSDVFFHSFKHTGPIRGGKVG